MITNKRILSKYLLPKLFNTELQLLAEVKYLGMIANTARTLHGQQNKKG